MTQLPLRQILFIIFVLGLSACSTAGGTTAPAITASPTPAVTILAFPPTFLPAPTQQLLSYTPAVYTDEENNFSLEYPAGWTLVPNQRIGDRGSQAQLLSPGASAEELPAGASRVMITVYAWDPQNDLAAYSAQRSAAWEASGMKILSESPGQLADGTSEMHFTVQAGDGQQTYFLLVAWGQRYLEIAGVGDLTLVAEIARTLHQ